MYDVVNVIVPILSLTSSLVGAIILAKCEVVAVVLVSLFL